MEEITTRISQALAKEEQRAEQFANGARIVLLLILTLIALFNVNTVSLKANLMNFSVLACGFAYGFIVFSYIRRIGYRPIMKYVTSFVDILLVFLLLFLYTTIDVPAGALKNYVFLIIFPLLGLTAFRYDRTLTCIVGGLAVALYISLFCYLYFTNSIVISNGAYGQEFFSAQVTYSGQLTKVFILCAYITLMSFLANYSRKLFVKLVHDELNLQSQQELMDAELTVASHVQTKLLPHTFPAVAGLNIYGAVEQGKLVGGDYCDFFKLADDELLFVVADVSGKGVPAALIMSQVHACMHILAPMKIELEHLIQRLNFMLYQSTNKNDFITFFAAEINTSRHVLTYVNAGHPPPLLYSANEFKLLSQRTFPLGILAELPQLIQYDQAFLPGDMLIAYTDGLLEQTDAQGQEFGEERLQQFIKNHAGLDAHPFVLQLLDEAKNFGQGKVLNDDVSIAALKFSIE
jgi:serine phosphatase RsbU (regulator of sigma subunit)